MAEPEKIAIAQIGAPPRPGGATATPDKSREAKPERRLALLVGAYRDPAVDAARLRAIGDRLEASFRRTAPRPAWWRRPALLAAACLLLAALPAAWLLRPVSAQVPMVVADGTAVRIHRQGADRVVDGRQPMRLGDRLAVAGGRAELRWGDGTAIVCEDGVEASVGATSEGGKRVDLELGRIAAEVAPQQAGRPLRIATPQADITVIGTAFRLEADAEGTRVEVGHGRIAVRRRSDGVQAEVGAGMAVRAADGVPLAAQPAAMQALRNPGFEQPLSGVDAADGWFFDAGSGGGNARLVSDDPRRGRRCLLLEQTRPVAFPEEAFALADYKDFVESPAGGSGHASVSQEFPVVGGTAYSFRFAWRSDGLRHEIREPGAARGHASFGAWLFWLRADGERRIAMHRVLDTKVDAGDWREVPDRQSVGAGVFTAPREAVRAAISFKLTTALPDRLPRVWVDAVDFAAVP